MFLWNKLPIDDKVSSSLNVYRSNSDAEVYLIVALTRALLPFARVARARRHQMWLEYYVLAFSCVVAAARGVSAAG